MSHSPDPIRLFVRSCMSLLLPILLLGYMTPAAADPLLHYAFESLSEDATVTDASPRNRAGRAFNLTDAHVVPGREGHAFRFNGVNTHIITEDTAGLEFPAQDFTVEVWFKPASGSGTLLSMLSDRSSSYGRYQLLLDNGVPTLRYRYAAGSSYGRVSGETAVLLHRWHHVAATFDRAAGQVNLYVNGEPVGSREWAGETWGSPGQPLYIGRHVTGTENSAFNGLIDEIRIEAGARSPRQIQERWRAPLLARKAASAWATSDVLGFVVPAISSTKWLPDVLPPEESIGDTITVIGAKDTFEPASFVLHPFTDIAKLEIDWTELDGAAHQGRIPRDNVTIRLVRRWFQSGNAWDGYPLKNRARRVLVPELLLHDQDLIRVDLENQENYLRADYPDGAEYLWISYPTVGEHRETFSIPHLGRMDFNFLAEPVHDAPTLKPVRLAQEESKQFWVTVRLPADVPADTYTGAITLKADGRPAGTFTLQARVLPFELPAPKTYYDTEKDFHVVLWHHARYNIFHALYTHAGYEDAHERTLDRLRLVYTNMREHNALHPRGPFFPQPDEEAFLAELRLRKEAGFPMDPIIGGTGAAVDRFWDIPDEPDAYAERMEQFKERVKRTFEMVEEVTGHRNIFFDSIDEGKERQLEIQRDSWKHISEQGGKVWATGWDLNFPMAGHAQDFHSWAGEPTRERAAKWHAVGGRVGSYAYPFTGPEDPLLWRRNQGLIHYKANYDAQGVYSYSEGLPNVWNDFIASNPYRSFAMIYPTKDGVIDTIAWEGFREGIDDIRYATLLKQLAEKGIASGSVDAAYEAKRALVWLELMDERQADLDTVRLEMIDWILKLRALNGGGGE